MDSPAPISNRNPAEPAGRLRPRLTVDEICAAHGNEEAHALHVAALALKLFDATHALFGVPRGDRKLLEAACRLHDIGYGENPRRHGEVGGRIVRRGGIRGFTPVQTERIATVIDLHASGLSFGEAWARAAASDDPRRVLHLAALLRIADALDTSHLQDATVASVRATRRRIRVNVRFGLQPRAIELARKQAHLWREAFPADVDLRVLNGRGPRAEPLVEPMMNVREAVRRLLFFQFRVVLINVEAATGSADIEALHDLRIAVRRMRAVLRAFRKPLAATSAERINLDLQRLNRILGAARDLDVWIGFCSGESVAAQFTGHRLWAGFVAHQLELRRLQQATVRRHLQGPGFHGLRLRIGRLLRSEIPSAARLAPPEPLAGPARRAIAASLRRIGKLSHLRHSRSPEKVHRLRIALRRLRYLSGFFGDTLGRPVQKLYKRAHAVEGVIGRIRDADLALSRILSEGPTPPRMLVRQLERLRPVDLDRLDAAWRRFTDPAFVAELNAELETRHPESR